jgi:hypothetical protein
MTLPSRPRPGFGRLAAAGAVAGIVAALSFTLVHQLLISPIWFALPAMLGAGALCGACLAWSYGLIVPTWTIPTWLGYNALFLLMFVALGVTSLSVFQPVTTITALIQAKAPPNQLISRALPFTGLFTLLTAGLLAALYRPGWPAAGAILVTTTVLILFLGLNISILGLVAVPRSALGVLGEVLVLLLVLALAYTAVIVALHWRQFRGRSA